MKLPLIVQVAVIVTAFVYAAAIIGFATKHIDTMIFLGFTIVALLSALNANAIVRKQTSRG